MAAVESSDSPKDYLIKIHRYSFASYHARFKRIVKRAKLVVWPKLLQNLRASRATELDKQYSGFLASVWAGHSESVAKENYWQVRDCDYEQATQGTSSVQLPTVTSLVDTFPANVASFVASTTRQEVALSAQHQNPGAVLGIQLHEATYLYEENGPERT